MSDRTVIRSPKIAQRRREVAHQRRVRRRRTTIALASLTGLAAGAFVLTGSSVFAVASIDVRGAQRSGTEAIVAASGLRIGENALSTDLSRAVERIEALPSVKRASISRVGGVDVVIEVVERSPAVEVVGSEQRWVLDRDGVALPHVTSGAGLPQVRAPWAVEAEPPLGPEDAHAIAIIWNRAERMGGADDGVLRRDLTFRARIGRSKVDFGALDLIREKLDALALVRKRVAASGDTLLALNVSSPDRPAVVVAG